ncbi:hypothetical protein D3C75_571320 [compost metagenome]
MEVHGFVRVCLAYRLNDGREDFSRYRMRTARGGDTVYDKIDFAVFRFDKLNRLGFDGIGEGVSNDAV